MKTYLPLILMLLVVVGGVIWIFINDSPPEIVNPKYTVGTITSLKQAQKSAGLDAVVTFVIDGKKYENRIGSVKYKANVIGEKYKVVYEEKDPSKNIVLTYEPVFAESESINKSKGIVKRIYRFSWSNNKYIPNHGIEFEYEVNGKKFTKAQSLPKDFQEQYPGLKEGGIYEVEYWNQNPERAIIRLDKSVK